MNQQLEQLVLLLDSVMEARGDSATSSCLYLFEAHLDDVLEKHPNLDREQLRRAVRVAYMRWVKAQKKPPAIPPQA